MEILNQVTLAGNLTDKPSVDDAGGRVFVRARLAQNWFYDTHGKAFEKGDNIHVTGQLIRRDPRARSDDPSRPRETGSIFEIHVIRAFRIEGISKSDAPAIHQNEIRRTNDAKQVPAFIQEGIHDWPV